jgi:hypothetical protein
MLLQKLIHIDGWINAIAIGRQVQKNLPAFLTVKLISQRYFSALPEYFFLDIGQGIPKTFKLEDLLANI